MKSIEFNFNSLKKTQMNSNSQISMNSNNSIEIDSKEIQWKSISNSIINELAKVPSLAWGH